MESRRHFLDVAPVDPGFVIHADIVRLSQVIENILINAAKYTPDGGRIGVATFREGASVAIEITDTGVGISPQMLTRVFELFAQADTSLDRAEGGLGIGLTLVEKLVRMHGGRVEARSPGVGFGSTFTVHLPLVRSDEPMRLAPISAAEAPGRRVLVVDDNVDSAEMLKTLLEMNGHTVRVAHDGHTALAAASTFSPNVILLDIGLPGMDGYRVIKELRALPSMATVTIVATTGYGREEDRARCLAAGFDDHLTKPIDHALLERILAAHV
jgi:two-component system CheB/CheR fusion protein